MPGKGSRISACRGNDLQIDHKRAKWPVYSWSVAGSEKVENIGKMFVVSVH